MKKLQLLTFKVANFEAILKINRKSFSILCYKNICEKRREDFPMLEMSQIDKKFIKGQLCRMETKVYPSVLFCDVCRLSHCDIFDERGENLLR